MKTKHTAKDLKGRIERRHPREKSWAVFTEMSALSGTQRTGGVIDAVAVCLSAPRDFAVHGFEVKISRGDWLSELNNPKKNAIAIDELDYWWIVAPSVEVVHTDELPEKWGLYTCSGKGLRVTKRAKPLGEAGEPFSRAFVVSLLWKFSGWRDPNEAELRNLRKSGYDEGFEAGQNDAEWDKQDLEDREEACRVFKHNTGCEIDKYNAGRLGALARCLSDETALGSLIGTLAMAERQAESVSDTLADSKKKLEDRRAQLQAAVPNPRKRKE